MVRRARLRRVELLAAAAISDFATTGERFFGFVALGAAFGEDTGTVFGVAPLWWVFASESAGQASTTARTAPARPAFQSFRTPGLLKALEGEVKEKAPKSGGRYAVATYRAAQRTDAIRAAVC